MTYKDDIYRKCRLYGTFYAIARISTAATVTEAEAEPEAAATAEGQVPIL